MVCATRFGKEEAEQRIVVERAGERADDGRLLARLHPVDVEVRAPSGERTLDRVPACSDPTTSPVGGASTGARLGSRRWPRAAAAGIVDAIPARARARVARRPRLGNVMTADGTVASRPAPASVATGDWILVPSDGKVVAASAPPFGVRARRPGRGPARKPQVVAANVDLVFVVQSLNNGPNIRRLERELVLAFESGADPVVVLSKADLVDPSDDRACRGRAHARRARR